MTRVLHLLDGEADWEQRLAVSQLLSRVPPGRCHQMIASLDRRHRHSPWFGKEPVRVLPADRATGLISGPALRQLIDVHRIDVVHAWGTAAAEVATAGSARGTACCLVISRFDPHLTDRQARLLRTLSDVSRSAFLCASETVRRRLVERGIAPRLCVVIRPGVDFAAINAAKRDRALRSHLGASRDDRLLVVGPPAAGTEGDERTVWAAHLVRYVGEPYRTILYGPIPEGGRLDRLCRRLPPKDAIIRAPAGWHYERLIAIADGLVVTPQRDASTTCIAWAMAASTAVIGTAVYAVAELIAHRQSGLLIKPEAGPGMAIKIAESIRQIDSLTREKEFARGSAYEAFGVRRFADQYAQVYENVLADAEPGKNIRDSAVA
jgi:glycosyltransferase involved in cell wall biosynthesis